MKEAEGTEIGSIAPNEKNSYKKSNHFRQLPGIKGRGHPIMDNSEVANILINK
jgi:hypothetical protein